MDRDFFGALDLLGVGPEAMDDVLDALPYAVFVDQVEQGCTYASQEALRMFDMDWDAFRGYGWVNAVLPEDMETLLEAVDRYEREKTWIEVEYRIGLPDESTRTIHVVGKAICDAEGTHLGSVMIGREVTSERVASDRMLQSQKLEAIGRLSGRVAHDINNVLTPILFSAVALEEEPLTDMGREGLATIRQGVDHAASVTRQLLGLSRHDVEESRAVELDAGIHANQVLLRQLLGEGITLKLDLCAEDSIVGMAAHELGQLLLNLGVNGRDAMSNRGELTIRTRIVGEFAELEVSDTGPGIPEDLRVRIFEPFFTTKTADRGTGLGLSTVKSLVDRSGGKIEVQDNEGPGARITVQLPCLYQHKTEVVAPSVAMAQETPLNVLVVDDDSAVRQTLAFVLALRRHKVRIAANASRALELLAEEGFDVLVTDVLLTDGTGPELVEKARTRCPDLRVVYMSGFAGNALTLEDLEKPHTTFLHKPFHPNQLAKAFAEVTQEIPAEVVG